MGICCPYSPICSIAPCLPCCHFIPAPHNPEFRDNSNWMKELHKTNPEIKLRDMKIPASHDSATYSISKYKCCASVAKCQRLSLYEQLCHGIRFFDIRIGCKNGEIVILHGPISGGSFQEQVDQVLKFIKETDEEFIVFQYKEENSNGVTEKHRTEVLESLQKAFGEFCIKKEDVYPDDKWNKKTGWFCPSKVKLNEIVERKKRILILTEVGDFRGYLGGKDDKESDKIFFEVVIGKYNTFHRNNFFENRWHRKANAEGLLTSVLDHVKEYENKEDFFLMSQFTLTPDAENACDILKIGFGINPVKVDQHVRRLFERKKIQEFFEKYHGERLNYCWFDFVDYDMDLVNLLIGMNYKNKKLIIKKAEFFKSTGEIENLKGFFEKKVDGSCFLYISNLRESIGKGKLTLNVQYEGEESSEISKVITEKNTSVLVSFRDIMFYDYEEEKVENEAGETSSMVEPLLLDTKEIDFDEGEEEKDDKEE